MFGMIRRMASRLPKLLEVPGIIHIAASGARMMEMPGMIDNVRIFP